MKVIFLDIDGVLNSENHIRELHKLVEEGKMTDKQFSRICDLPYDGTAIPLKKIVDKTGAVIVLSSSWRLGGPEPEVGKIYHGFDDGKIRLSRLVDWKVTKRIDLDKDKVSKHLIQVLQRDIKTCYWVFDPEQTVIFYAKAVDENGKYDKQIGTCYFIRTKAGGWFSAYAKMFWWCELDVDNRWYNTLIKE